MLKDFTVANLLDLNETIAAELFEGKTYPWEVLPEISDFIMKLGPTLNPSEYECKDGNVWIAKSAKIAPTAYINGPAIIGKDAEVRHCAFIRGNVIVGEGAVVGNSTELKNAVLFNKVQVPHSKAARHRMPPHCLLCRTPVICLLLIFWQKNSSHISGILLPAAP